MAINGNDKKEVAVGINDHDNENPTTTTSTSTMDGNVTGKIWRESSCDFFNDVSKDEKQEKDQCSKDDTTRNVNESYRFDFVNQSTQDCRDPPSNLIDQFLHKQQASGEFCLDMDLEMAELQNDSVSIVNKSLNTVKESPVKNRVSFDPSPNGSGESLRRRLLCKESPGKLSNESGDGVIKCSSKNDMSFSSNSSAKRKSNLLKERTKSRLMDPPVARSPEILDRVVSKSGEIGRSGQLKSGFMSRNAAGVDEEEDDPLLEEDLPEELKRNKIDIWVLLEWVSLVLIIGALICVVTIPKLRNKSLWSLSLWKWGVLVLVLICGRLVSGWVIRIIVFFVERNFLLRKRVLYFVYGIKNAVQNCLWLGLVLIAWHFLFDERVQRQTKSTTLHYVTKILICLVVGTLLWLVKTLAVKVLASSFHVSTYFDRIQDSLFNQYVIETLSGPPLIEMRNNAEDEEELASEVQKLQNAGATVPPALKATTGFPSPQSAPQSARAIGSGRVPKTPRINTPRLSRVQSGKADDGDDGITIDHLHKLNPKNVSAWNMKRLINIVRHGALSTLDEQIRETKHNDDDESATKIRSEYEAKAAARKIFQNVAAEGSRYIHLDDVMRFMPEDEAVKTMNLFEGASESKKISKKCLKNWVVNAFRERRALALTLNDTKTAVNKLHRIVRALVAIIIVIIWLLILGIATSKFLLFISSQLLLVAFIFGNTCKTVFEAIIFLFVIHPFDVGDRVEIDGVQMIVEEMNILTTLFLRFDNQKIVIANAVLATKTIGNYYRSPDMLDVIEFLIHLATPAEKIAVVNQRITSYIENKKEHWYTAPMIIFKDAVDLNKVRIAIWPTHKMNHQDMVERLTRRSLLIEEMMKIFRELDIQYRLLPIDINVRTMPPISTERLPVSWTS